MLICEGMDDYSFLVGLVYPCVLVGFCTVYAFQTRKCPGGFNEVRSYAHSFRIRSPFHHTIEFGYIIHPRTGPKWLISATG